MSRDLTKKFYIKTTRSDIYGCGIHEIHLDGNDHFILRLENGSRTYMEPILTVLNTTLIQAFKLAMMRHFATILRRNVEKPFR